MNLPELNPTRAPHELVADIERYLDAAQAQVTTEDVMSLEGLDVAVASLCQQVQAMAPDEGKRYRDTLKGLVNRLDTLKASMTLQRTELAQAITSLNTQKKANRAYAQSTSKKPEAT